MEKHMFTKQLLCVGVVLMALNVGCDRAGGPSDSSSARPTAVGEQATAPGDPIKAVAVSFQAALEAGDEAKANELAVVDTPAERFAVGVLVRGTNATFKEYRACVDKWGDRDAAIMLPLLNVSDDQTSYRRAVVKIDGDIAKLYPEGFSDKLSKPQVGDELLTLRRTAGRWKVLLAASLVDDMIKNNGVANKIIESCVRLTPEIAAGKYRFPEEVFVTQSLIVAGQPANVNGEFAEAMIRAMPNHSQAYLDHQTARTSTAGGGNRSGTLASRNGGTR
jgi:hypothetical protein